MNNGIISKILGWVFFGSQLVQQVATGGLPHGFGGWAQLLGALAVAIGIHAAGNVGQIVQQPTPTTVAVTGTGHIVQ